MAINVWQSQNEFFVQFDNGKWNKIFWDWNPTKEGTFPSISDSVV